MIGPVYAHDQDLRRENSPNKVDRTRPIGIVQFINKLNYQEINDYDIDKFKAMQSLIGYSIE